MPNPYQIQIESILLDDFCFWKLVVCCLFFMRIRRLRNRKVHMFTLWNSNLLDHDNTNRCYKRDNTKLKGRGKGTQTNWGEGVHRVGGNWCYPPDNTYLGGVNWCYPLVVSLLCFIVVSYVLFVFVVSRCSLFVVCCLFGCWLSFGVRSLLCVGGYLSYCCLLVVACWLCVGWSLLFVVVCSSFGV